MQAHDKGGGIDGFNAIADTGTWEFLDKTLEIRWNLYRANGSSAGTKSISYELTVLGPDRIRLTTTDLDLLLADPPLKRPFVVITLKRKAGTGVGFKAP